MPVIHNHYIIVLPSIVYYKYIFQNHWLICIKNTFLISSLNCNQVFNQIPSNIFSDFTKLQTVS